MQLLALACMLVLLFPVISASDDLHAAQLAVETSGMQKSSKWSSGGRSSSAQVDHHPRSAVLTTTVSVSPGTGVYVATANEALRVGSPLTSRPPQDRAPPIRPYSLSSL
jgi:hypothetical protein